MTPDEASWYIFSLPLVHLLTAGARLAHEPHPSSFSEWLLCTTSDTLQEIQEAMAQKREIIYVSMGTVLTGDHPDHGWHGQSGTLLTGQQLCQAAPAHERWRSTESTAIPRFFG